MTQFGRVASLRLLEDQEGNRRGPILVRYVYIASLPPWCGNRAGYPGLTAASRQSVPSPASTIASTQSRASACRLVSPIQT
jgi:hypothetical protein